MTVTDVIATDTSRTAVSTPLRISSLVRIVAALLLLFLLTQEWVQGGNVGLEGGGGGGFGILTLITALVVLFAAVQALRGQRSETKLLGPNQLAIALTVTMFFANLVFLWVFRTGGAPKWVYVAGNVALYAGIVGLFAPGPKKVEQLDDGQTKMYGIAMTATGVLIAAAPLLAYTDLGSRTLSGYEPGAPRIGIALLIYGAIVVFVGMHRALRGASQVEVGPYVLWPHVTMQLGVIATGIPAAWLISGLWGNDFDPGVGVYLSVGLGLVLFAIGAHEAKRRDAPGI